MALDIAECVNVRRRKREKRALKRGRAVVIAMDIDAGGENADDAATNVGGANEERSGTGADGARADADGARTDAEASNKEGSGTNAGGGDVMDAGTNDKESEAAVLQKQDAASAAGCPIGSHIEVEWDEENWYAGVVTNFNLETGEHYVVYDDGEEQDEDLQVMKFRFDEDAEDDSAEVDEEPAPTDDPWCCAHCDFSSPYLSVATAHEQRCLAHQAQEAISREQLLWSPDADKLGWTQQVASQLGWTCGSQTFGSEKLAMKHFQAFNKFTQLRELYRPTRCMCKHEIAQHEARAASYGNWYPVR